MTDPSTERLRFDGIDYWLHIPRDAQSRQKELRVLVSIHGTNTKESPGLATNYLGYVTEFEDEDRFALIVVAPQFPTPEDAPDLSMNGKNFDSFASDSHHWLHTLLHCELPHVLARRGLTVYTDKVHLFGHSRSGQFIHTYMLKYYSEDVLRATICGPGLLRRRSHSELRDMPIAEYQSRMKAFVQADVAIIIGTSDCVNTPCLTDSTNENAWDDNNCGPNAGDQAGRPKWARIRHVMDYFKEELAQYLGEAYMKCIIQQEPPDWHPDRAFFPIPSGPATDPVCNKRIRFYWTPNRSDSDNNPIQGHSGHLNYQTARRHLFESIPMLCPATEVERHGWTSGWSTAKFYTVGGATYLFLLKSGDGTVHIHRMNPNGTIGAQIEVHDWSSGWTTAEFYTIGSATFLFLLKASDGMVHIQRLNADGTIGARVQESDWSSGWTTAEFYRAGSATFVLLLKSGDGTVHIHRMNPNGTVSAQVEAPDWSSGWTTAEFYTVGGATFLFLLKSSDGTAHLHQVNANGTVGARVQEYAWSRGWTAAEFYAVGGATFLFLLKSGDGTVHIHRMNADGTVGARVVTEIQEHDWSCGWTSAEFYTVGGSIFLFLLSRSNGTVHIHRIPRMRMQ